MEKPALFLTIACPAAFSRRMRLFFAALCVAVVLAAAPVSHAEKLIIGGSGSNLASIRLLASEFTKRHPEITVEMPASLGSSGGIRAAAQGALALGLTSRPLRESEEALGVTLREYAKTAVVIAVNPGVPQTDITTRELVDIFAGKKTRWRNGKEIIVLSREPGDSGIETLIAVLPPFAEVYKDSQKKKRWTTLYTDQEMNKTIANTGNAVGISDSGTITSDHLSLKMLKINGIYPSQQDAVAKKYPFFKSLSFVFRKDRLSSGAKAFVDFAVSPTGLRILTRNGYLPPGR